MRATQPTDQMFPLVVSTSAVRLSPGRSTLAQGVAGQHAVLLSVAGGEPARAVEAPPVGDGGDRVGFGAASSVLNRLSASTLRVMHHRAGPVKDLAMMRGRHNATPADAMNGYDRRAIILRKARQLNDTGEVDSALAFAVKQMKWYNAHRILAAMAGQILLLLATAGTTIAAAFKAAQCGNCLFGRRLVDRCGSTQNLRLARFLDILEQLLG